MRLPESRRLALLLIPLATALTLAVAPRADAFIYWTQTDTLRGTYPTGTVGLATQSASRVIPDYIRNTGSRDDPGNPCGVAVNSDNILWANNGTRQVSPSIATQFIKSPTISGKYFDVTGTPCGVAITDRYIFWVNNSTSAIGRAMLDGRAPVQSFIGGLSSPCGIAADTAHVYWGSLNSASIGRANLDGTGVEQSFIKLPQSSMPCGVGVDAEHLYWANRNGSIGRAQLDGGGANPSFVGGLKSPCGVAVAGGFLYWGTAGQQQNPIGRARADDGGGVNPSFINTFTRNEICGIAVDSRSFGSSTFTLGGVKHNVRRGTARLSVEVDGPGKLVIARTKRVKRDSVQVRNKRAGKVRLRVRPRGKAKSRLKRPGAIRVKARVTFTAKHGEPNTKARRLRLIKR
jgi:virginiamycin B lyase